MGCGFEPDIFLLHTLCMFYGSTLGKKMCSCKIEIWMGDLIFKVKGVRFGSMWLSSVFLKISCKFFFFFFIDVDEGVGHKGWECSWGDGKNHPSICGVIWLGLLSIKWLWLRVWFLINRWLKKAGGCQKESWLLTDYFAWWWGFGCGDDEEECVGCFCFGGFPTFLPLCAHGNLRNGSISAAASFYWFWVFNWLMDWFWVVLSFSMFSS